MKQRKYSLPARLLYWLMAVGFVFMWACGYTMTELVGDDSPLQEFLFDLHISVGVTLLFLLALRIVVRLTNRPPPIPMEISELERVAAHLGHGALYALPVMVMTVGWAETNFGGHTVKWFGVAMPKVFPDTGEGLQVLATDVHMWLAYTMLGMAALHVAATYKHRWIDGHDVIRRMTFGDR